MKKLDHDDAMKAAIDAATAAARRLGYDPMIMAGHDWISVGEAVMLVCKMRDKASHNRSRVMGKGPQGYDFDPSLILTQFDKEFNKPKGAVKRGN